ncbi:MAG: glycosyltransferase family 4 protein [Bacteroidales bacterium]
MIIGIEAQRIFRKKKHGMDMVALELIKNLMEIDTKNTYLIFVKPDSDKCICSNGNFHVIELNGGPYPLWEQYALPHAARKFKCDLLHCTSNTAPIFGKTPLVITLHDIIYLESLGFLKKGGSAYQRLGNLYRRIVVPPVVRKSKVVVTVSNFEQNRISAHMGVSDNLTYIYNGVGEHFGIISQQGQLDQCKQTYNLPDKFVFFLGNTDPKKNTPNVLKAFAHFNNNNNNEYSLVMLDFEESALMQILNDIEEPAIRKYILLTGYIPNNELPKIINLCTLFLYPSLRESFGIPILEGMACGAPVVTSNTSSMPEIAGDAALIVEPTNYLSISNAMQMIIDNPLLRESLIDKGLKRASMFSWKEMAKKYLELYKTTFNSISHDKE